MTKDQLQEGIQIKEKIDAIRKEYRHLLDRNDNRVVREGSKDVYVSIHYFDNETNTWVTGKYKLSNDRGETFLRSIEKEILLQIEQLELKLESI